MSSAAFITKGTRVQFRFFRAQEPGTYSLAGAQAKVAAQLVEGEGVVTHVRGDHPTSPTSVGLWVRLDDGSELGPFDAKHVLRVVSDDPR